MAFHTILCPIDFSRGSETALRAAVELAHPSGARLVLAHVWEPSRSLIASEAVVPPGIGGDMIASEEAELAKWQRTARELGAKEVSTRMLTGVPWDQIVLAAQADPSIDLIVMGTHGRTGLERVLLGSVAEKVVRHAPCAVLVVRLRDDV